MESAKDAHQPLDMMDSSEQQPHSSGTSTLARSEALPDSTPTPESTQHHADLSPISDIGLRLLSEVSDSMRSSEFDDSTMSRVCMNPDVLAFYRTPGVFKLYRRSSNGPVIDYFHSCNRGGPIPENVVIEILSFLNKRDLCNAMASCRLMYLAGLRCKTWEYVDLFNRTVFNDALISFLNRRLKVMRLADTNIEKCPYSSLPQCISLEYPLLLTHLDLSRAVFSEKSLLTMIMVGCTLLQALSMEGQDLRFDATTICRAIAQNTELTHLDLSMTLGIEATSAQLICLGCTKIQHLNLSWSSLDYDTIMEFCSNLPDSVTRLNLAGSLNKSCLDDEAVERIVVNCQDLMELDLSDNINITEKGLLFINSLPHLESLSLNRCYGIPPTNYLSCGHLYALNVFGCITDSGLSALKSELVDTKVNESVFNYIAKPTVPPAVTSIWGQRTKDFY